MIRPTLDDASKVKMLRDALAGIMNLVDSGKLVRDISGDADAAWAIKQLEFVIALKSADDALEATK